MRKCSSCEVEKEENRENFAWHTSRGKYHSSCRECKNKRNKELYNDKLRKARKDKKTPEYHREKRKNYLAKNREKVAEQRRNLYHRNRDRELERQVKWREGNPDKWKNSYKLSKEKYIEKYKARKFLNYAIEYKLITKPNLCERCGIEENLDGHHEDYSKPLEVLWVCKKCHGLLHRKKY
jgi:hypothetical protein